MSDEVELLPCPHCGGEATCTAARHAVWCAKCRATMTPETWNRRAPQPATGGEDGVERAARLIADHDEWTSHLDDARALARALLAHPQPATAAGVTEAREKIAKAEAMVAALCKDRREMGSREWVMSIPARPDYDPDLVIAGALHAADRILAALAGCSPGGGGGWVLTKDNLPSYGQPVWCYWPGRFTDGSDPGMQGVAVRGIHMPNVGVGDMSTADRWHSEDDVNADLFTPLAWRPLPPAPAQQEKP